MEALLKLSLKDQNTMNVLTLIAILLYNCTAYKPYLGSRCTKPGLQAEKKPISP